MLIAQLSDLHIRAPQRTVYGCVDTAGLLEQALCSLKAMPVRPDVVLITGDLTDHGQPEEYEHLRALLTGLPFPLLMVPGNHDRRGALRTAFAGFDTVMPDRGPIQYVVDDYEVRLIGLDSVSEGQHHGELGWDRLRWLDQRLAEARDRPTVLFMHHPPFQTGYALMDRNGCRDGRKLGAVMEQHPQVQRVLCGHLHRTVQVLWHGTMGCVAPSTAHQMHLDLRAAPEQRFCLEPPGFLLHWHEAGNPMATHACSSGHFPAHDIQQALARSA